MECRLCLNKSPSKSIFSLQYKFTQTIISLMNVIQDDGLPELICKGCVRKVKNTDDFIRKCEESNTVLRSRIVLDIKYEPDEKELKCEVPKNGKDLVVDPIKVEEDMKSDCYNSMVDSGSSGCELNNVKNEETNIKNLNKELKRNEIKCKIPKENKTTEKNQKIVNGGKLKVKKKRVYKKGSNSSEYSVARLCPLCGVCYKNKNSYSLHLKKHSGKKFQCDFCSGMFYHKGALKSHMKSHMPDTERYSCRFCEKSLKFKSDVKKHEEIMHIKSKPGVNCHVCGKKFRTKAYLSIHMITHNRVRNKQCEICSKAFLRKGDLRKHLAYHADERPFVCKFCQKAFRTGENCKKHERLHTGETPHRCPVCLKGFAQKCNMRSHFVHNHKELDFKETMTQFQTKNQETQQGTSVT